MGEGKTSFSCSSSKPRGRIEDEDENEKEDEAAVHGKPPFVFRMPQAIVRVETLFMESPLSFFACIGTMNQIGTPLPARRGEGGRRRGEGWFMERTPRTLCAPCSLEPASGPLTPSLSPLRGGRGCPKGGWGAARTTSESPKRGGSWAEGGRQAGRGGL